MIHKTFGICGRKNSGKTTLVASLVREFTNRGYRVSTVKHAHHHFSIDKKGTDSYAHREAGAQEVALVSDKRWALIHEVAPQEEVASLEMMIAKLAPCDLVLVEGYKAVLSFPKIECIRQSEAVESALWPENPSIKALACEKQNDAFQGPQFDLDEHEKIANYISQLIGLHA